MNVYLQSTNGTLRKPLTDANLPESAQTQKILREIKDYILKKYSNTSDKNNNFMTIAKNIIVQLQIIVDSDSTNLLNSYFNIGCAINEQSCGFKANNTLQNINCSTTLENVHDDDINEIKLLYVQLNQINKAEIIKNLEKWVDTKSNSLFNQSAGVDTQNRYIETHINQVKCSGRSIEQIKDSNGNTKVWLYNSRFGSDAINNNGEAECVDKTKIVCRHLAFWFLWNDTIHHDILSSLDNPPPTVDSLYYNDYDKLGCNNKFNHLSSAFLEELGFSLYKKCKDMQPGDEIRLILSSETHDMAVKCRYKAIGYLTLKFYDPNKTEMHTRAIMGKPEDLQYLKIGNLLSPLESEFYFPKFKTFLLATHDRNINQDKKFDFPNLEQNANFSSYLLVFCRALQFGAVEFVNNFIELVLNSNLNDIDKVALLSAINDEGNPGLLVALHNGHAEAVKVFIDAVLESALNDTDKVTLLGAIGADGVPGLSMALQYGYAETVKVFIDAVLESALNDTNKVTLLSAMGPDGISGLIVALYCDHV
ncbi:MAG: uncharacterized protein QG673_1255, partial [Pseudomonadota bacterium]|nr:uncharacterized protein [Pseudomonadota bacterium]